jgi:hypothetical protein
MKYIKKHVHVLWLILFALTGIVLDACTRQKSEAITADRQLYEEAAAYTQLKFFPNTPATKFNSGLANKAHGDSILVRVNAIALASIDAVNKKPVNGNFADGALIVKQVYNKAGDLEVLAVMKKKTGAGGNNWLWAEYEPGGNVKFSATANAVVCTSCHASGKDNVRIFDY